jgi:hypothetical protein
MAKAKANTQWAVGTRPARMDREDGQWEHEMSLIEQSIRAREDREWQKNIEDKARRKALKFKEGDLVYAYGRLEIAEEIDPNGSWVKIRGHKHGTEGVKHLPLWFKDQYAMLLQELERGN